MFTTIIVMASFMKGGTDPSAMFDGSFELEVLKP